MQPWRPKTIQEWQVSDLAGRDTEKDFGVIETPNGDPDADTEVSPTSHEIMEAITDPDVNTGWTFQDRRWLPAERVTRQVTGDQSPRRCRPR
jgi:hypothetical protein